MKFQDICNILAARRCRNAGQSVKQIAASAKVSESTIRQWLKITSASMRTYSQLPT
jgi:transposase